MSKIAKTTPGATYVVECVGDCVVINPETSAIVASTSADKPQGMFVATRSTYEVSDDTATVVQTFNSAATAALGGGESESKPQFTKGEVSKLKGLCDCIREASLDELRLELSAFEVIATDRISFASPVVRAVARDSSLSIESSGVKMDGGVIEIGQKAEFIYIGEEANCVMIKTGSAYPEQSQSVYIGSGSNSIHVWAGEDPYRGIFIGKASSRIAIGRNDFATESASVYIGPTSAGVYIEAPDGVTIQDQVFYN